jgi:site-specific recombinase XerD
MAESCRDQEESRPVRLQQSAASHMLENVADLRDSAIAGHASIMATEIYTHGGTRRLKSVRGNMHPRGVGNAEGGRA